MRRLEQHFLSEQPQNEAPIRNRLLLLWKMRHPKAGLNRNLRSLTPEELQKQDSDDNIDDDDDIRDAGTIYWAATPLTASTVFYAKLPRPFLTRPPCKVVTKRRWELQKRILNLQHLEQPGSSEDHQLVCRMYLLEAGPSNRCCQGPFSLKEHIFLNYPSHSTKLYLLPVKSIYSVFHTEFWTVKIISETTTMFILENGLSAKSSVAFGSGVDCFCTIRKLLKSSLFSWVT